jgi:EmrB/QacA subfamily drug resistance transporter
VIGPHRAPCDALVAATAVAGAPPRALPTSAHPPDTAPAATSPVTGADIDPFRGRTLAAAVVGSSMAFIDGSVVNVALPTIQRELGGSGGAVQGILTGYLVVLAALVLAGGAAADRFGRRRTFRFGVIAFTAASALCGLAPEPLTLVAARCLQGAGAAFLVPASLAMLGAAYPPADRGRAIGIWAAAGALTSALGPVLGGWLADSLSWRWIFFLNLPLGVAAFVLAARTRETAAPGGRPVDLVGTALATAGLALLAWGLTDLQADAAALAPIALIGAGVAALVAFLAFERHAKAPMLPLTMFASRAFSGANALTLALYFALTGVLFFLPFLLVRVHDYSATAAGAALVPFPLVMAALSTSAGRVADRIGPRLPLTVGPVVTAIGLGWLGVTDPAAGYFAGVLPPVLVLAFGMACTVAPLTAAVMGAAGEDQAGTASGVNNAVARVAGALAVAVLGIVFVQTFDGRIAALPVALRDALPAEALAALAGTPLPDDATGRAIAPALHAAFRAVALTGAACALAAGLIGWVTIGGLAPAGRRAGASDAVPPASGR